MSNQPRRRAKSSSRTRRLSDAPTLADEEQFWFGKGAGSLDGAEPSVRVPDDPTATVRSLGLPPIATRVNNPEDHAALIDRRLSSVYEGASAMAAALGAAAGIVADDEPDEPEPEPEPGEPS